MNKNKNNKQNKTKKQLGKSLETSLYLPEDKKIKKNMNKNKK
jgi:hypothetical protein